MIAEELLVIFNTQYSVLLALLFPLTGVLYGYISKRSAITFCILITCIAVLAILLSLLPLAALGNLPIIHIAEIIPHFDIVFYPDPLGMLFAILVVVMWAVTMLYSHGYLQHYKAKDLPRFYTFFSIAIFATLGAAFAGNIFTLFIFYEILTLVTVPLVAFHGGIKERNSARIYIIILLGSSMAFFLPAIILTDFFSKTTNFIVGGILPTYVSDASFMLLFLLYFFGISKTAVFPLHSWLPNAMVAPVPVSALLHAVAVVKVGIFALIKVAIYIFGIERLSYLAEEYFLMYIPILLTSFTMIYSGIKAAKESHIKHILAYSTISQLSTMVFAILLFSKTGIVAAIFLMVVHSLAKITLFFIAGSVSQNTGKIDKNGWIGMGKSMPITMALFTLCAFSIIGIPPLAGALAKSYLISAVLEKESLILMGLILLSTIVTLAYFIPLLYRIWWLRPQTEKRYEKLSFSMMLASLLTTTLMIALFLYPEKLIWLAKLTAGLV